MVFSFSTCAKVWPRKPHYTRLWLLTGWWNVLNSNSNICFIFMIPHRLLFSRTHFFLLPPPPPTPPPWPLIQDRVTQTFQSFINTDIFRAEESDLDKLTTPRDKICAMLGVDPPKVRGGFGSLSWHLPVLLDPPWRVIGYDIGDCSQDGSQNEGSSQVCRYRYLCWLGGGVFWFYGKWSTYCLYDLVFDRRIDRNSIITFTIKDIIFPFYWEGFFDYLIYVYLFRTLTSSDLVRDSYF